MEQLSHFDPASLEGLDEPVQRYFRHALAPGARLGNGVRLGMAGRIKLGMWLPFKAEWEGDGGSFAWRARIGWGPLTIFRVVDGFADGAGSMDVRLFGRVPMVHAAGEDTARSGAGRAAVVAARCCAGTTAPTGAMATSPAAARSTPSAVSATS